MPMKYTSNSIIAAPNDKNSIQLKTSLKKLHHTQVVAIVVCFGGRISCLRALAWDGAKGSACGKCARRCGHMLRTYRKLFLLDGTITHATANNAQTESVNLKTIHIRSSNLFYTLSQARTYRPTYIVGHKDPRTHKLLENTTSPRPDLIL